MSLNQQNFVTHAYVIFVQTPKETYAPSGTLTLFNHPLYPLAAYAQQCAQQLNWGPGKAPIYANHKNHTRTGNRRLSFTSSEENRVTILN
jgi:hypothetical protein